MNEYMYGGRKQRERNIIAEAMIENRA